MSNIKRTVRLIEGGSCALCWRPDSMHQHKQVSMNVQPNSNNSNGNVVVMCVDCLRALQQVSIDDVPLTDFHQKLKDDPEWYEDVPM